MPCRVPVLTEGADLAMEHARWSRVDEVYARNIQMLKEENYREDVACGKQARCMEVYKGSKTTCQRTYAMRCWRREGVGGWYDDTSWK